MKIGGRGREVVPDPNMRWPRMGRHIQSGDLRVCLFEQLSTNEFAVTAPTGAHSATVAHMTRMRCKNSLALAGAGAVLVGTATSCIPPVKATLPAPVVQPSSGPAGRVFAVKQPKACPAAPAGSQNNLSYLVWDPKGKPVDSTYIAETPFVGPNGQWPDGQFRWGWWLTAPKGKYTLRVVCRITTPGRADRVTYYKDAFFTISGPPQRLSLSATTLHPGDTLTVRPAQSCPAGTTSVSAYTLGVDVPAPNGVWSSLSYTVPTTNVQPGPLVVDVQCMGPPKNGFQSQTLFYQTYTVKILAH